MGGIRCIRGSIRRIKDIFASSLDRAIVMLAERDLRTGDRGIFAEAALFIFPDGRGIDAGDPNTFQTLCDRNRVDPNSAAEAIFAGLRRETQRRVVDFLRSNFGLGGAQRQEATDSIYEEAIRYYWGRRKKKTFEPNMLEKTYAGTEARNFFHYLQNLVRKGKALQEAVETTRSEIDGEGAFRGEVLANFNALVRRNVAVLNGITKGREAPPVAPGDKPPRRQVVDPLLVRREELPGR